MVKALSKKQIWDGWQMVRFGDVAKNSIERVSPEPEDSNTFIGLEHLVPGNLRINNFGSRTDLKAQALRIKKGDILFPKRNTHLRRVAISPHDCVGSADFIVIQPQKKDWFVAGLLKFIMQTDHFHDFAISNSAGSLSKRTKWKVLVGYEFPLPPIEIQKKALTYFKKLETCICHAEKCMLATLKAQKKVRFEIYSKMEKDGLNNKNDIKSITLKNAGQWLSGGTPSKKEPSYWGNEIPWFCPKDMKTPVLENSTLKITELGSEHGAKVVPPESILLVVRGMILVHTFPVGITAAKGAFNQDIKALIPGEKFLPRFLFHWFREKEHYFLSRVTTASHGTKRLSSDVIYNTQVPVATLQIQYQIANILDRFDHVYDVLSKKRDHFIKLKQALYEEALS